MHGSFQIEAKWYLLGLQYMVTVTVCDQNIDFIYLPVDVLHIYFTAFTECLHITFVLTITTEKSGLGSHKQGELFILIRGGKTWAEFQVPLCLDGTTKATPGWPVRSCCAEACSSFAYFFPKCRYITKQQVYAQQTVLDKEIYTIFLKHTYTVTE